jgi:hypothetical protein
VLNFNILLEYPWWFVVFCAMAGFLTAALLYYKSKAGYLSPLQKKILAGFRFLAITLLCILLLAPMLQRRVTHQEAPAVLFFQDNSLSVISGRDSIFMQNQYPDLIKGFIDRLSDKFSVQTYSFGESIQQLDELDYQDKITDMSQIFISLKTWYSNRNVGAVIIAGDGIFNRGTNPLYEASSRLFPVYTIALGDTIPQRDLIINRLRHNTITYLNNIFPLEITLEAHQASGKSSILRVMHNNKPVFERRVSFSSEHHFETIVVELEARETGLKRYRVEIVPIEDEVSVANNRQDFFIEVIDSRQKVLVLANSPHPDIGAIKQALEDNDNYEVSVFLLENFKENIRDFDMIIWHQLPSARFPDHQLFAQASDAAQLFIVGAQSNLQALNRLQTGIQITPRAGGSNDARAHYNENFNLFSISDQARNLLPLLPPLHTHFANYTLSPAAQSFLYQRIGTVVTEYPLIAFSETSERKTAIITGEGLWRWRLTGFARNANHEAFNELISRMVQFVSVVEDKSFFRVQTQNFLYENEQALFNAELYNRSYELVNEPEVRLTITNEDGVNFDYVMGRTINSYSLNAGSFPVGEYSYRARVNFAQENYTAEGKFSVSPLHIERNQTVANHQLLHQIATQTGAQMFYPNQLDQLIDEIQNRNDIRPVLYTQKEFEAFISLQWIFFLILIFLTVEWFVRKYNGGY